ncbi:hypothetical protein [Auritidibacter ignavus]|uniref:hypothetical protein n=1 Tax=Auritidibacter ignavus TaxID=678932 RepID=UPI002FE58D76
MNSQSSSVVRAVLIDTRARTIDESAVPGKWKPYTKVAEFGGVALTTEDVCRGEFGFFQSRQLRISDLRDAAGEWVAVASSQHLVLGTKHLVFADRFGFGPVFYAILPGRGVLVSDNFIAVATALRNSGATVSLNVGTYVSALTSRGRTAEGISDSSTMAEEIQILEPDCVLEITGRQATIRPRVTLGGSETINDYDQAVNRGLELAKQSLSAVVSHSSAQKVITLSGGVDSRLALALLTLTGAHRDFEVLSFDPRKYKGVQREVFGRDIQIANAIRAGYGMDWLGPTARRDIATTFIEGVFGHQIRRSNLGYEMFLSNFSGENIVPQISVRGGGGELLRTPGSAESLSNRVLKEYGPNIPLSDPRVTQTFLHAHAYPRLVTKEFRPLVTEHYERTLERSGGADLFERLNGYYFRTRNRYHFGGMREALDRRELALLPLANPFFLQASRLVDFRERAEGKLVRDIFQASAPELLRYPFDSETWTTRIAPDNDRAVPYQDLWVETYDAADSGSLTKTVVEGGKADHPRFSAKDSGDNFIREGLATIVANAPEEYQEPMQRQHEAVLRTMSKGVLKMSIMLGKVASALDVVTPQPSGIASMKVISEPHNDSAEKVPRTKVQLITSARNIPEQLTYPEPFESQARLRKTDKGILVSNDFKIGNPEKYEFAFYLYCNRQLISRRWYKERPRHLFAGELKPGAYTALVFVRKKDNQQLITKVRSTKAITI